MCDWRSAALTACNLLVAFTYAGSVEAIVLTDPYFTSSGGDASDVAATLDAGYADARAFSVQKQFQAVGTIGQCTATWIGNDEASDSAFFLTAAHCIEQGTESFPIAETFTDWDGNVVASGSGTGYVPPERINPPPGFGGSSTDIALLKLPGQVTILDDAGLPVAQPVLHDRGNEVGYEVALAGYGSWGVMSQGSSGGLFPSSGARRAGGTNIIQNAFEADHALRITNSAPSAADATPLESGIASGDSGSAWWQEHAGQWSIIATTCCINGTTYGTFSNATRVAEYTEWIRDIYPGVRFWSEADPSRVEVASELAQNDQANGVVGQVFSTGEVAGAVTHISVERATSGPAMPDQTYLHVYADADPTDGIDPSSFLGSSIASESLNPANGGLVYWEFDGTSIRLEPDSQYLFAFASSPSAGDTASARVALHNGDGASGYAGGFAPVDFSGRTDLNTLFDVFLDVDALTGVAGDVNQDGVLNLLDVDAFVASWRSVTISLTDLQKTMQGDLNLDGITNLLDAFELHEAFSQQGMTVRLSTLLGGSAPEPSSCLLLLSSAGVTLASRRDRASHVRGILRPKDSSIPRA